MKSQIILTVLAATLSLSSFAASIECEVRHNGNAEAIAIQADRNTEIVKNNFLATIKKNFDSSTSYINFKVNNLIVYANTQATLRPNQEPQLDLQSFKITATADKEPTIEVLSKQTISYKPSKLSGKRALIISCEVKL
jgi:hypothetical protein